MNRRCFLRSAGASLAVLQSDSIDKVRAAAKPVADRSPEAVAADEDFWFQVRHAFTVDRNLVNFNNGGVCPSPRVVQEAERRYLEFSNLTPTYYMWRILTPEVEVVRRRLAASFGADPEEVAITRNASEALEAAQLGIDLKPGDEVITTTQDYPRMLTTWDQRRRRDGIVVTKIKFPVPPPSLDDLYERMERAITPRTKVIHFCHITNLTGQIFPVQKICRMARQRGILTIVDGAHAYAHFPFKRDHLDCDYYGTSLHKWLTAPIGTGFLYVRRELISRTWPLMAAPESMQNDIRKFEEIGTHPAAQRNAITEALTFHESIGAERKAARMRYLRERWCRRLEELPGVRILTSYDPAQSCGLGLFSVEGISSEKLSEYLLEKHRVLTVPIRVEGEYEGVRVTPNVYTTLGEIDTFCAAVEKAVKGELRA